MGVQRGAVCWSLKVGLGLLPPMLMQVEGWAGVGGLSQVLLKQDRGVPGPCTPTSVPWDAPSRGSGSPGHISVSIP